jgi:hypothetical protein
VGRGVGTQAAALDHIGGCFTAVQKPTGFLCLALKLLQIQPDKDIVIEYIRQDEYKYLRALGAFYLRLTGNALDVYRYLEPLYNDYRKLRRRTSTGASRRGRRWVEDAGAPHARLLIRCQATLSSRTWTSLWTSSSATSASMTSSCHGCSSARCWRRPRAWSRGAVDWKTSWRQRQTRRARLPTRTPPRRTTTAHAPAVAAVSETGATSGGGIAASGDATAAVNVGGIVAATATASGDGIITTTTTASVGGTLAATATASVGGTLAATATASVGGTPAATATAAAAAAAATAAKSDGGGAGVGAETGAGAGARAHLAAAEAEAAATEAPVQTADRPHHHGRGAVVVEDGPAAGTGVPRPRRAVRGAGRRARGVLCRRSC